MVTKAKKIKNIRAMVEICPYCSDNFKTKAEIKEHLPTCIENPEYTGRPVDGLMDLSGIAELASDEDLEELGSLTEQLKSKRKELIEKSEARNKQIREAQNKRLKSGYQQPPIDSESGKYRTILLVNIMKASEVLDEQESLGYELVTIHNAPNGKPVLLMVKSK
jgi:hypothetical protein